MKRLSSISFFSLLAFPALLAQAYEISAIKVIGENEAQISFVGAAAKADGITQKVVGNTIELVFSGAKLAEGLQGKLDVDSPHALIHRASLFEVDKNQVKALIVMNGTAEGLKNRAKLFESSDGTKLKVEFPKGENAALNLFKEEQQPLKEEVKTPKKEVASLQWVQILMVIIVFIAAGTATYFMVRFMKSKGSWKGSRKFLMEQLSYIPVGGTKTGVSLIKVGTEFVLVGVTPNQITFLSSLPKLQEQYEDESKFERGAFKEAVQEEMKRKPFNA